MAKEVGLVMFDYVSWYLIELSRRLGRHVGADDLLLEAKNHLEERVEELTSKGLERSQASRAAITEFGDPDLIVWAVKQRSAFSKRAYWMWSAILSLMICSMWIPGVRSMFGTAPANHEFWPAYAPLLAIFILGIVAGIKRTWLAKGVLTLTLGITLVTVVVMGVSGRYVRVPGQFTAVAFSQTERQIQVRQDWIARADRELPSLQAWLNNGAVGMPKEAITASGYYLAPTAHFESQGVPNILLQDHNRWKSEPLWIRLGPTTFGHYLINFLASKEAALAAWKEDGPAYVRFVGAHRSELQMEIEKLGGPGDSFGPRIVKLFVSSSTALGAAVTLIVLVNGTVLLAANASRRRRWEAMRRQIA